MTLLSLHAVVYVAANLALVLLWLLLGGELASLRDPIGAVRDEGFWPLWVAAFWGVLLAFHAGVTAVVAGRRRRKRARRHRRAARTEGPRWITAMFTDIVGSTALNAELGDEVYSRVLAAHRDLVRSTVGEHGGVEVGTQGDGFLLRFDGAADAMACAIALQRRVASARDDEGDAPRIRIGMHAGEAVARDGDVVGKMVNLAARVADEAGPEEVLVTEPVAEHAPSELDFEDRGLCRLRGVQTPRHVLALRWDAG
jgi:class 3 adenylate cyclase